MQAFRTFICSVVPGDPAPDLAAIPLLRVSKNVTIDAPVAAVWARAGDFGAIDAWLAAVAGERLIHGKNNVAGAVRNLDIGGGGYVKEELLDYSAERHCYRYRILDSVLPLSDYHSELSAQAEGPDTTVVTWSSTFRRKDAGPNPPAGADDATALKTIAGLYEAGLENLKKVVEHG